MGDGGLASILSGERLKKSDAVFVALGNLDELSAALGVVVSLLNDTSKNSKDPIRNDLLRVESELLRSGTMLAIGNREDLALKYNFLVAADVLRLEHEIDSWQKTLPELKNFLIPGGSKAGAYAHLARAICRRTERSFVRVNENHKLPEVLLAYMNRLSDWLFVLGRILNKNQELIYAQGEIKENH